VTDELTVQVISCTFADDIPGLEHGHGTWRIVGPRYLRDELPGRISCGRVATVAVYAQEDVPVAVLEEIRVSAEWNRHRLLEQNLPEEAAEYALPDLVMTELWVSASLDELLRHLAGHVLHSVACRAIDLGLARTLVEAAPGLAGLLPEGVFGDSDDQKT